MENSRYSLAKMFNSQAIYWTNSNKLHLLKKLLLITKIEGSKSFLIQIFRQTRGESIVMWNNFQNLIAYRSKIKKLNG
jgi:hypothetical protein